MEQVGSPIVRSSWVYIICGKRLEISSLVISTLGGLIGLYSLSLYTSAIGGASSRSRYNLLFLICLHITHITRMIIIVATTVATAIAIPVI